MECKNAVLGLYSQALSFEPKSVDKVQKNERDMEDHSYKYERSHVENIAASWIPAYNNSVINRTIMILDPSKD